MTLIRRHILTGEPILFAPERALRAGAFDDAAAITRCPFCPGHEEDTPPEIARAGDPWQVRVVPNRYPAAPGAEVIVESSRHDETFDRIEDAVRPVAMAIERMRTHRTAAHVALFKNEGRRAGSTIPHVHSQLIPLSFIPPRVEREAAAFSRARECPLCAAVSTARAAGLILREDEMHVWLAPDPASMPYQQWIVPARHVSAFTALNDREIESLARFLQSASAAMLRIGPSYNWTLQSFPNDDAHAYVELFPRITTIAGLEIGTGTFVEIIDPAAAARRLRD